MVSEQALIGLWAFFRSFVKPGHQASLQCVRVPVAVEPNDWRISSGPYSRSARGLGNGFMAANQRVMNSTGR